MAVVSFCSLSLSLCLCLSLSPLFLSFSFHRDHPSKFQPTPSHLSLIRLGRGPLKFYGHPILISFAFPINKNTNKLKGMRIDLEITCDMIWFIDLCMHIHMVKSQSGGTNRIERPIFIRLDTNWASLINFTIMLSHWDTPPPIRPPFCTCYQFF